jgi:uncharacterized protein YbjT (DUF2867 family)
MRILVTGATGYLGPRIIDALLAAGHEVRAMTRDLVRFDAAAHPGAEVVQADPLRPETLPAALDDVDVAYYLIHSMANGDDFHEVDRRAARAFGQAAKAAGVARIIYLGGLGNDDLSPHLASRQETGRLLGEAGVPVTEFRAGMIVGTGSISFEMVRTLVEHLPVMVTPRWVQMPTQPIGIVDTVRYMTECLAVPESVGRVIEIGGEDVVTYEEMMLVYARLRGLRRHIIRVPVITPRLSSYWVNMVTPVPASVSRALIESLKTPTVVRDDTAQRLFPDIHPLPYAEAIRRTMVRLEQGDLPSSWTSSASAARVPAHGVHLAEVAGVIIESRSVDIPAPPSQVWPHICGIGGERGWLYADLLWQARAAADRLIGGVGFRRRRRDRDLLRRGDVVDWWRVEEIHEGRRLLLHAEMKLPGDAWLDFELTPTPDGSRVDMHGMFDPKGVSGRAYWWGLYPLHRHIFSGMMSELARRAALGPPA